jgi:hypothetical protein
MNDETFNVSIRKFLKNVGVRSQMEIEKAVAAGVAAGKLKGNETLPAQARITINGVALDLVIDGVIALE